MHLTEAHICRIVHRTKIIIIIELQLTNSIFNNYNYVKPTTSPVAEKYIAHVVKGHQYSVYTASTVDLLSLICAFITKMNSRDALAGR